MTVDVGTPAPPDLGPPLAYQRPGWASARPIDRVAAALLETGLIRAGESDPLPLLPPFPWGGGPDDPVAPDLASWAFLDALLEVHAADDDPRYLEPAVALARDWASSRDTVPDSEPTALTAVRAWRLAYVLAAAERYGGFGPGELQPLWNLAAAHETALAGQPGVLAACGRLALATRLTAATQDGDSAAQSVARRAFLDAFDQEGVHRSHDPATHNEELGLLSAVLHAELLSGPDLVDLQDRAEEALGWFVLPDGTLATFGDTGEQYVSPAWDGPQIALHFVHDRYRTETLRHLASMGRIGAPPPSPTRVFTDAGYLVIRPARRFTADRDPGASYVALQSGNDRALHPQRDDLAMVWFDRGRRILVNGGAQPIAPSDSPGVKYFVSPRAHNTVTVDGGRPTETATLERWGELKGVVFADARAEIGTVTQRRSIMTRPTEWLLVVDTLFDNVGATHNYRQWFHAAEDLDLVKDGDRYMLTDTGVPFAFGVPLRGSQQSLTPLRCKTAPRLDGWWAPQPGVMVPNWTFGWELNGAQATFATLFTFDQPAAPTVHLDGTIGWAHQGVETVIALRDVGLVDIQERATDTTTETA